MVYCLVRGCGLDRAVVVSLTGCNEMFAQTDILERNIRFKNNKHTGLRETDNPNPSGYLPPLSDGLSDLIDHTNPIQVPAAHTEEPVRHAITDLSVVRR